MTKIVRFVTEIEMLRLLHAQAQIKLLNILQKKCLND